MRGKAEILRDVGKLSEHNPLAYKENNNKNKYKKCYGKMPENVRASSYTHNTWCLDKNPKC